MEALLSVEALSVGFATRAGLLSALDGISFSIARGEILGMIGESGAGKSVAGAAIVGLIASPGRITGGTIHLAGERIDDLPEEKLNAVRGKRIGMIFQDPMTSLNPLISIGDQLVETIRRHLALTPKQARARAIELLAETGIPDPAGRIGAYPHEFSGGMRQRVVIALALAGEPDLVIADEPTTALDVSVQAGIIALIEKLCRERGTAVLLITHDMGVIARAAQRVAVMYAGRIIETAETEAILGSPRHPYTRGLMQAIPPLAARPRRLLQIPGAMPRLSAMPPGCAFHPRCAFAEALCRAERPELVERAGRPVACHFADRMMAEAG